MMLGRMLIGLLLCWSLAMAQNQPTVGEAVRLAQQGKTQEAIEMFETLLQRDPENKTVLNWLGYLYLKTGKYEEAVPVLEKAVKAAPKNPEAWNNLGNAYLHTGQIEKAIDAYKQVIAMKPDYADAHYNLGNLYTSRSSISRRSATSRRRFSSTRDANAHNNLGYAYQMMKLPSRALPAYKRAVELEPNNITFRYNYALVNAELGNWREVVSTLEAVMPKMPNEDAGWLKAAQKPTRASKTPRKR